MAGMTRRDLEGKALGLLVSGFRYPLQALPKPLRPLPMANIREITMGRPDALSDVERIVPDVRTYLEDFSGFWDEQVVPVAIRAHARFHGEFAGAGPVDFLEALTLYSLVREHRPNRILESGFASGISSWILARGLVDNGNGELDTVDIADNGDIVDEFHRLTREGVIHPTFGDALEYVRDTPHTYQMTFSDALHTYEFNRTLAATLRERFPGAIHCYHEWSLGPGIPVEQTRHVSMRAHLGVCGERQAFEEAFRGYRRSGVASSSGLGVIMPIGDQA